MIAEEHLKIDPLKNYVVMEQEWFLGASELIMRLAMLGFIFSILISIATVKTLMVIQ